MSSAAPKFFLTTPIYYVNARPHIGHAYTTIVADVLARRSRSQGRDTFFLTGTDEHGQKIERSAQAAGIPPQQFADQVSHEFRALWTRMGLTHDDFIRTTDPRHKRGAQKLFAELYARGAIYLSSYTGQYCVSEEIFVEGPPGVIGPDGKPTETVTEENFFFRLSDYQLPLINLIESDTLAITPESRKNEVLSFLRGSLGSTMERFMADSGRPTLAGEFGSEDVEAAVAAGYLARTPGGLYTPGALRDLSVSRSSFTWGIPVPEPAASATEKPHVMYVWLDALANYMTAIGYGTDTPEAEAMFAKYWPADLHIMAKEITRQHCIYWPAFLLAAGLPLPKAVVAHGWLLFDDSKMSKSKGNIVRTETILDAFGTLCPPPPSLPLLSSRSAAEGSASALSAPPQNSVILSEARSAQSKDLPPSNPAPTAQPTLPQTPEPGAPTANGQEPTLNFRTVIPGEARNLRISSEAPQTPTPHDRDLFAADVLRYFLLREIPFGQDGSFSFEALITRYNADLANGYGNLVSRTLKMISTSFGKIPALRRPAQFPSSNTELADGSAGLFLGTKDTATFITMAIPQAHRWYQEAAAAQNIISLVALVDGYLSSEAPWKLKNEADEDAVAEILYTAAESIRIITALLHPILPNATARVWVQLGLGDIELAAANGELKNLQWGGLQPGTKLGPLSPIFPRADKGLAAIMTEMESAKNLPKAADQTQTPHISSHPAPPPVATDPWDPAAPPRTSSLSESNPGLQVAGSNASTTERPGTPSHAEAHPSGIFAGESATPQIAIDDFAKIDLRVARIIVAERIPKADKLLRLEVDLGTETRQILSGIAEWYTPEELLGRRIVIIANLAPRKMRGLESHGMLLAASTDGGKPSLATFPDTDDLPLGSRLK